MEAGEGASPFSVTASGARLSPVRLSSFPAVGLPLTLSRDAVSSPCTVASVRLLSTVSPQSVFSLHRLSAVCPPSVHRLSTVCPLPPPMWNRRACRLVMQGRMDAVCPARPVAADLAGRWWRTAEGDDGGRQRAADSGRLVTVDGGQGMVTLLGQGGGMRGIARLRRTMQVSLMALLMFW